MIVYGLAQETQLIQIAEIEQAVMPQPWQLDSYRSAFKSDSGKIYVAYDDALDRVAGFVVLYVAATEGEIPDVVVDPFYRRQGIAESLLNIIFNENPAVDTYFLEVRESNEAAIGLYNKLGFEAVGLRKNFYSDPVEHAICMSKVIDVGR